MWLEWGRLAEDFHTEDREEDGRRGLSLMVAELAGGCTQLRILAQGELTQQEVLNFQALLLIR